MKHTVFLATALTLLSAGSAYAHPGHTITGDFTAGFVHPFIGLDHILAMVAVGLLAAQSSGKSQLALPAIFVGVMALGGLVGLSAFNVPYMEQGILASVILLGAVVAFGKKLPLAASAAMVALFAIFHGAAHGVEMPADMTAAAYGVGMMIASAALHGAGITAGRFAPFALRYAGAAVAFAGLGLAAV
jgi:urease accessory protein